MHDFLFQIDKTGLSSLQSQIRRALVAAILNGQLPHGKRVPSSRELARTLKVSRNTVMLAYQGLLDDGYLEARERSGYFVSSSLMESRTGTAIAPDEADTHSRLPADGPDWNRRLRVHPSAQRNINKPERWHNYPYPFIYGQIDHTLFPIAGWRECSRQALGKQWLNSWTDDMQDRDDPMLIDQIRSRVLPRRGVMVAEDEILVTLGAQNALYLLAGLLVSPQTTVGLEEPGYPDARNIFSLKTDRIVPLGLDEEGVMPGPALGKCDLAFLTPSHHFPTTVTMSLARRRALLAQAVKEDIVLIEDDYEFETNYSASPTPALKSFDRQSRVIYVGSLSKTLFPGLRLGFLVAPREIITEARALRRLMARHPPCNNQRTTALFLSLGHYDALLNRLHRVYRLRWEALNTALSAHMPEVTCVGGFGGSSVWVTGPDWLDAARLAADAMEAGIIIEPGQIYFARQPAPSNCFRMGFSSIDAERIPEGIEKLAAIMARQRPVV